MFCGLRLLDVFTGPLAANPGLYSSAAAPPGQMAPAAVREERRQPAAFSASPACQQAPPPEEEEDANDYDSDEASECTNTPAWVHFNQENNDKRKCNTCRKLNSCCCSIMDTNGKYNVSSTM